MKWLPELIIKNNESYILKGDKKSEKPFNEKASEHGLKNFQQLLEEITFKKCFKLGKALL